MSKELKITKALLDQGSWCQHLVQRSFVGDRNALLAIKLCTAIDEQGTEDHQGLFWTKALGVNISVEEALLGIEMHFSQSSCALPSMSKELRITKALMDQGSRCQHLVQRSFIGDRNALLAIKLCTAIDEQRTEDHQGSFGPRLLVSTSRSKKLYWGSKCTSRNRSCALPSMSKELKITKALLDQGSWCQHLVQRSSIGDRNALLAIKLCTAIDEQGTEDHQGSFGPRLLLSTSRSKKLYWGSKCTSRNQAVHCHR